MQLETFYFDEKSGWSVPTFPAMDSERTLVLIFADPKFNQFTSPIEEIMGAYKKSPIMGCSTAGEIYQKNVFDNRILVAVIKFEHTDIRIAHAVIKDQNDSFDAGMQIINSLAEFFGYFHGS